MRGAKPGERRGGRAKGTKNRRVTTEKSAKAEIEVVLAGRVSPLEYLLSVLNEPAVTQMEGEEAQAFLHRCNAQLARRMEAAKAAAPYTNARLQAIETKQDPEQFAKEHAAKLADMDITEIARRVLFVIEEARRIRRGAEQAEDQRPEARTH